MKPHSEVNTNGWLCNISVIFRAPSLFFYKMLILNQSTRCKHIPVLILKAILVYHSSETCFYSWAHLRRLQISPRVLCINAYICVGFPTLCHGQRYYLFLTFLYLCKRAKCLSGSFNKTRWLGVPLGRGRTLVMIARLSLQNNRVVGLYRDTRARGARTSA